VGDPTAAAFHAAHEQAYGFSDPEATVELVTVRVSARTSSGPALAGASGERPAVRTAAGGAQVLDLPGSTIVIPRGWAWDVLEHGTVRLSR
jgi:hypothetical protein